MFPRGGVCLVVLLAVCGLRGSVCAVDKKWDNDYEADLNVTCSPAHYIKAVKSQHDNEKEDRQWVFTCDGQGIPEYVANTEVCEWHLEVNKPDHALDFKCPSGSVLAGVASKYSAKHEDRVWDYRCCKPLPDCKTLDQTSTGYLSWWDWSFDWKAPEENFIVGFYSFHRNWRGDRRWKAKHARLLCECLCVGELDANKWQITDIEYDVDHAEVTDTEEFLLAQQVFRNPSRAAKLSSNFEFSKTMTESYMFSHTRGVTVTAGIEVSFGIPALQMVQSGSVTASVEVTAERTFTWGEEMSTQRSVKVSYAVEVPPMTHVMASGMVTQARLNVPYNVTVTHRALECKCNSEGVWIGVQQYNEHAKVEDLSSGSHNSEMLTPSSIDESDEIFNG